MFYTNPWVKMEIKYILIKWYMYNFNIIFKGYIQN